MTDPTETEQVRRMCVAYNRVLLAQPEDARDQPAAMTAVYRELLVAFGFERPPYLKPDSRREGA